MSQLISELGSNDDTDINTEELPLQYSKSVIAAIQEIVPGEDPFDSPDFNAVDYINERFPAEQSLHLLDEVLEEMRVKLSLVENETQQLVRQLAINSQIGQDSLQSAEESIRQLSARFQEIKVTSGESEQRVRAITRDIRQLDTGKRNLTTSINTLNHLQMLTEGVDKIRSMMAARQYGELAPLLQGVLNVMQHLSRYTHIPQVKQLSDQVLQNQKELEQQILADFRSSTASLATPSYQLAEACLVANVLDKNVRRSIMELVVEHQLAEYRAVFAGSERDGWLTCVDLRRKWFLRAAVEFDRTLAQMFPPGWKVPARLAYSFCRLTHEQLTQAMALRTADIDSTAILQAHRLLSDMESLIIQKYGTSFTYEDLLDNSNEKLPKPSDVSPRSPVSATSSAGRFTPRSEDSSVAASNSNAGEDSQPPPAAAPSPYDGAITSCFLPYLHIHLNTLDKRLGEQIERFMSAVKSYSFDRVEEEESNVMPCCGELFTLYKNMLVEYLRVSQQGYGLPNLIAIFQRRLREFATRVLREALPQASQQGFGTLPKDMKDISAIISQVQSLLVREGGESLRLSSEEEVRKVCSVLVSAEYCAHMTNKLQAKLLEKWQLAPKSIPDPDAPRKVLAASASSAISSAPSNISLAAEEELFHAVLSQCILLLVGHVESLCDGYLASIPKLNWLLEQTGDQSSYVSQLSAHLSTTVPLVRYHLHTSRKHFTRFCDKLAAGICIKFTQQVYRCRPINSIGCEQLLLDCHALKAVLLHMPVMASKVIRDPPVSYTRMVTKSLARPELVLQVVMGEYSSPMQLVEKSIRLMPDLSLADFQKVLELRGIKDKAPLLESYRQRTSVESDASATTINSTTTTTNTTNTATVASPEHELSRIAKLEKMLKARRLI
ncbi:vacuolar protein sorting-associated protein 53 homolog isoform X2 [Hyalella azteca]|uniref:Vacuolar protein sorting-associated protein 53 homolog n=1 Tax=Hyalella azteca TaxID=294128 RepID=A0A8B7N7P1_HYAAZ|nr:vacuolar protein sorting-associated protein 53 homolog isoform X2 [Hyalella azteca]